MKIYKATYTTKDGQARKTKNERCQKQQVDTENNKQRGKHISENEHINEFRVCCNKT